MKRIILVATFVCSIWKCELTQEAGKRMKNQVLGEKRDVGWPMKYADVFKAVGFAPALPVSGVNYRA